MRYLLVFSLFCLLSLDNAVASLEATSEGKSAEHPQILYWFFTPQTIASKRYLSDLDQIAKESPFTLIFLTAREGAQFNDTAKMHPVFKELVAHAHKLGLKIGLQLFTETRTHFPDETQGLVEQRLATLDRVGVGSIEAEPLHLRGGRGQSVYTSEVLSAYLFKTLADGVYDPKTLRLLKPSEYSIQAKNPYHIKVKVSLGEKYAGYCLYVSTVHYLPFGDVFSPFFERGFSQIFSAYKDIPFDGTALDEFGTIRINPLLIRYLPSWHGRWYSLAFAKYYEANTHIALKDALFQMSYSPLGNDSSRIKAITSYFDLWRQGVLKVERSFYTQSKAVFGAQCFAGVHDTFHNRLTNDEYWANGLNWWAIPREYGQTDEDTPLPTRFGIALGHPNKIPYNMFYDSSVHALQHEALLDASFNSRVHYHAYNDDNNRWGADLRNPKILSQISLVENKVRLLNQFDGPEPDMHVLVIFGFPALTTWYPKASARNAYDLNGDLHIEEKAVQLWNKGYLCALIPSDKVDEGAVTINGPKDIVYGGHHFNQVVYLYPQYAKQKNLLFLEALANAKANVIIEGEATRDFNGADITERFNQIRKQAAPMTLETASLEQLGVFKNDIEGGCRLVDGSVLIVNEKAVLGNQEVVLHCTISGKTYFVTCTGLLAIKVDNQGQIEKLAASGLRRVTMEGGLIWDTNTSEDCVLKRVGDSLKRITFDKLN